jgi:hypothetical protein
MNPFRSLFRSAWGLIVLLIIAVIGLVIPPTGQGQLTPTDYGNFAGTSVSNFFAHGTNYTIDSTRIELRKDQGIAILPFVGGHADATNLATFTFEVSADGTNYATSSGLTIAKALSNSTNAVSVYQLWGPATLNNVRYIRLASLATAATNTVWLYRMQYSRFW